MMATSFGAFQIMWFNYKTAWYSSVWEFVEAQKKWIWEQMKAFANFCMNNRPLYRAMQSTPPNFQQIAYYYNGPKYAINNYDNKIAQRFAKFDRNMDINVA
jgi:hypothetical protein